MFVDFCTTEKCIHLLALIVILLFFVTVLLCGRSLSLLCSLSNRRVDCLTPTGPSDEESQIVNNGAVQCADSVNTVLGIFLDLNDFQFASPATAPPSESSKVDSFQHDEESVATNSHHSESSLGSKKRDRLTVPIIESLINISKSIQGKFPRRRPEPVGPSNTERQSGTPDSSMPTTPISESSNRELPATPLLTVSHGDGPPEHIRSNIFHCICYKQSEHTREIIDKHVHFAKYKHEPILLEYGFTVLPPTSPSKEWWPSTVEKRLCALRTLYHPNIAQLTGILALNNNIVHCKTNKHQHRRRRFQQLQKQQQQQHPNKDSKSLCHRQRHPSVAGPKWMPYTITVENHKCRHTTNELGCFKSGLPSADKETFNNVTLGSALFKPDDDPLTTIRPPASDANASQNWLLFSREVFVHYYAWQNCYGPSLAEVIHGDRQALLELRLDSSISAFVPENGVSAERKSFETESLCINRSMKLALLNDIVQAMLYLQSSGLVPYHGTLNLRNCYLDSRYWRAIVAGFAWCAMTATADAPVAPDDTVFDEQNDNNHGKEHRIEHEMENNNANRENIVVPSRLSRIDLLYVAPEHLSSVYSFFQASPFPSSLSSPSSSSPSSSSSSASNNANHFGSSAGDVYSFSHCIYQFIFELLPFETYFPQMNIEQILQGIHNPECFRAWQHREEIKKNHNNAKTDAGNESVEAERDSCPSTNQLKCENNSIIIKTDQIGRESVEYLRSELALNDHRYDARNNNTINVNKKARDKGCRQRRSDTHEYNDLILLMQQCWNHDPIQRPTFVQISQAITVMQICNDRFRIAPNKHSNHNHQQQHQQLNDQQCLPEYSDSKADTSRINMVLDMFRIQNRKLEAQNELSNTEKFNSQMLLNRVLPSTVSRSLLMGEFVRPEKFDSVTIAFSDIVGFTTLASYSSPLEVVEVLNNLFTAFDLLLKRFDVYKVETIGDAYMVASGVPIRNRNHECQIALLTLEMLKVCAGFKMEHMPGVPLQIRVGIHTGPVVGGVVGTENPRYCLFGDTVNIASRLESTGQPNMIHVSRATQRALKASNAFVLKYRDSIELRGRGRYPTYWLLGAKGVDQLNDDDETIRSLTEQQSSSLEESNGHGIIDESIFTSIGLKQQEI